VVGRGDAEDRQLKLNPVDYRLPVAEQQRVLINPLVARNFAVNNRGWRNPGRWLEYGSARRAAADGYRERQNDQQGLKVTDIRL
jgi:hypothetical protein